MAASRFRIFLRAIIDTHNRNVEKRDVRNRGECANAVLKICYYQDTRYKIRLLTTTFNQINMKFGQYYHILSFQLKSHIVNIH